MLEGYIELDEIYFIFPEYAKESAVEVRRVKRLFSSVKERFIWSLFLTPNPRYGCLLFPINH